MKKLFDFFRPSGKKGMTVTPLTSEEVRDYAEKFKFVRTFTCGMKTCTAQLRLRCRENRGDGPSNFVPYPPNHKSAGHSQIPSALLNWNGLVEERGWTSDPVRCPACQRGMTVAQYKAARRQSR